MSVKRKAFTIEEKGGPSRQSKQPDSFKMEFTSQTYIIPSENDVFLNGTSHPNNDNNPVDISVKENNKTDLNNTSQPSPSTIHQNNNFLPEKYTTVEYIEKGDTKEFIYTKYEEKDSNAFDRLYLRRSWTPEHPKRELEGAKRFTIAGDVVIGELETIGCATHNQSDDKKKEISSDANVKKRPGAIESLKQILEADRQRHTSSSTPEKPSRNFDSNDPIRTRLSPESVEKLKTKYSPSNFGFPKLTSAQKLPPLSSPGLATRIPTLLSPKHSSQDDPTQDKWSTTDYNNNKDKQPSKPLPNPKPHYLQSKPDEVTETLSQVKDTSDNEFPSDVPAAIVKRHHVYLSPKRKIPIRNSALIIKDTKPKEEESDESEVEERVIVVRHSSSEDSVDKVDEILSQFVMDKKPSEKKRSNSFRKLFRGTFFGRDKKKDEDKEKIKFNDQIDATVENSKNSFVRNSVHRHTVDGSYKPENVTVKNGYDGGNLKLQTEEFNPDNDNNSVNYKRSNHRRHNGRSKSYTADSETFNDKSALNDYRPMDKPVKSPNKKKQESYINVPNIHKYIDASSSSSDSRNNTYENSLIAQAELRQMHDSERKQNNVKSGIPKPSGQPNRVHSNSPHNFAETPPRAQDTYQNVQLIKPKALIPINSERPLPNPYRYKKPNVPQSPSSSDTARETSETLRNNLNVEIKNYISKSYPSEVGSPLKSPPSSDKTYLDDTYGEPHDTLNKKNKPSVKPAVPARNSSLEGKGTTYQKLPSNIPRSSPITKSKSIEDPLEIKTSSPTSSKLSDSTLSPRSRDSFVGVRSSPIPRSPKSPISPMTLERTKLKLPSNREKVELQPRVKSPIPKAKVSTEKLIATELLRINKESSEMKQQPENQKIPEGERSKLVITKGNATSKMAVTSPTKLPRPPVQRNILQELQIDPSEVQIRQHKASQSQQVANYVDNKIEQKTPSPQNNSRQLVVNTQLSPREQTFQYSDGVAPLRQQMLLSPQPQSQYLSSNEQAYVPIQQYQKQNVYVNQKSPQTGLEERTWRSIDGNKNVSLVSLPNSSISIDPQRASISNFSMSSSTSLSPRTRSSLPPDSTHTKSPQKQQMLQNVEAYYWRELKKMKEKEEVEMLNYKRLYGYVEDPVVFHRSRSSTPNVQHNARRSLSLPREVKTTSLSYYPDSNINYEIINKNERADDRVQYVPIQNYQQQKQNGNEPIAFMVQQLPRGQTQNFIRRSAGRNTIGPIGSTTSIQTIYENYPAGISPALLQRRQQMQNPIFRRGSLISSPSPAPSYSVQNQYKKVSFGSQRENASASWPTKNGYTQSPPQRRLERVESLEDDVFIPNSPRIIKRSYRATSEPVYNSSRVPMDPVGNNNFTYPNVQQQTVAVISEPPYGHSTPKQVSVSNKVCDIYGQIHDSGEKVLLSPEKYGQIKQTGVIYGTLQSNVGSRLSLASRQSNSNLSEFEVGGNFVRGTRLTSSVSDMYRRYPERQRVNNNDQRYVNETMNNENTSNLYVEAPTRPLPPLPPSRRSRSDLLRKAVLRGNPPVSDNDSSGSEAGEIQRILQADPRNNRINALGK